MKLETGEWGYPKRKRKMQTTKIKNHSKGEIILGVVLPKKMNKTCLFPRKEEFQVWCYQNEMEKNKFLSMEE